MMNTLRKRLKTLEAIHGLGQPVFMVDFVNGEHRKMTFFELGMYAIDRQCNLSSGNAETAIGLNGPTPHAFKRYTLIRGNERMMSAMVTEWIEDMKGK